MRYRFEQRAGWRVRAVAVVAVVALAGLAIVTPMGCGKVESTPTGTPAATTNSSSQNTSKDAIPVTEIIWEGNDTPTLWTPVVSIDKMEIKNSTHYAPTICWTWDQPDWPYKDNKSLGNNWIMFKIDGAWHATPWEHLPAGDHVCRQTEARGGQPPFIQGYGPIARYQPKQGEDVGFMNSTIARGSQGGYNNPHERSYVYMTKWQDQ